MNMRQESLNPRQQAVVTAFLALPKEEQAAVLNQLERPALVLIPASTLLPRPNGVATEAQLREENRIQDDAQILAKLGYAGKIPEKPEGFVEECIRQNGTLVLDFRCSLVNFAAKLNETLGEDNDHLYMRFYNGAEECIFATESPSGQPVWKVVPNSVRKESIGLAETTALNQVPGSQTCEPRDFAIMLGYHNLKTQCQMPGFKNRSTYTSQKKVIVGSYAFGIHIDERVFYVDLGYCVIGLAPRLAPESKS